MKKLNLFLIMIAGIIFTSCQQDLQVIDSQANQDVIFNIGQGQKSLKGGSSDCVTDADYALVKLKDIPEPLVLDVISINGELFSATVKLAPGSYVLEEFFLMKYGDPDDILISATPHALSTYGDLIVNPVSIPFEVTAFGKVEVNIDVICYDEAEYENFGFLWFKINVIHVREGLFFGDHCSEEYGDYAGSIYGDNPKYDMAAIFKVDLWLNNDDNPDYELHIGTFNNFEDEDGNPLYVTSTTGSSVPPLSVTYIDRPDVTDNYMLVISVYQKNGDIFEYVPGNPWYFTDDISEISQPDPTTGTNITITPGNDGIYDFISGPCIVSEFDFNVDESDPEPFVCDECEGGLIMLKLRNDGPSASIIVKDDNKEYFEGTVLQNEVFEFNGTKSDGKFEKNNLEVYVNGTLNTTIHVSCSQPVNPGLSFGSFTIVAAVDKDGTNVCPVDNGDGSGQGETAFGYDANAAICFLDIPELNNQRWGWTNQYSSSKEKKYEIPLYAGAAHCDPTRVVGKFKFEVKNGLIKGMKFKASGDNRFIEVHVYVGTDKLPMKNGQYTVAPGQFTLNSESLNKKDKYEFSEKLNVNGTFYVIAHAAVVDKDS